MEGEISPENPNNFERDDLFSTAPAMLLSSNDFKSKFRRFSCSTCHKQLSERMSFDEVAIKEYSAPVFGSLCLADISGFTRLSAVLSAEQLKCHINEYFKILLTVIRQNHGDVVKFLGDAVLIIWPVEKTAPDSVKAAATIMACICALQLLKDCGSYDRNEGDHKVQLRLHCGVVCGLLHTMCVGEGDRWEYLISGTPLKVLGEAESEANAGECCISQEAYEKVCDHFEAVEMPKGSYRLTGTLKASSFVASLLIDEIKKHQQQALLPQDISCLIKPTRMSFLSPGSPAIAGTGDRRGPPTTPASITVNHKRSHRASPSPSSRRNLDDMLFPITSIYRDASFRGEKSFTDPKSHMLNKDTHKDHAASHAINILASASELQYISLSAPSNSNSIPNMSRNSTRNSYGENDKNNANVRRPTITLRHGESFGIRSNVARKSWTGDTNDYFSLIRSALVNEDFAEVRNYLQGFLTTDDEDDDKVFESPSFTSMLRSFVHSAARSAIQNGTDGYLPELRNVTTIFVEILEMDDDLCEGRIERPQAALLAMLDILKEFEGSLRQYVVDDKGCVMIAAFGLTDSSHEDNCVRAVEVAIALRSRLRKLGLSCRIGISEGRVYCGVVGCINDRCEYAMMGVSVNLAARVMGKCRVNEILVSETVFRAASEAFMFLELEKIEAKGFANPVGVYRPVERSDECYDLGDDDFFGRVSELKMFSAAINRALGVSSDKGSSTLMLADGAIQTKMTSSKPHSILIQGGPGVGKSRLVSEVFKMVKEKSSLVTLFHVKAVEARINSPYYVIRQLLEQVFQVKTYRKLSQDATSRDRAAILEFVSNRTGARETSMYRKKSLHEGNDEYQLLVSNKIAYWIQSHTSKEAVLDTKYIALMKDAMDADIDARLRSDTSCLDHNLHVQQKNVNETSVSITDCNESNEQKSAVSGVQASFDVSASVSNGQIAHVDYLDTVDEALTPADPRRTKKGQDEVSMSTVSDETSNTSDTTSALKLINLVPLLGDVLSFEGQENAVIKSMNPMEKQVIRSAFILRMLLLALDSSLSVIAVDNLQWIDSQSLLILTKMLSEVKRGLFIAAQRMSSTEAKLHNQSIAFSVAERQRRDALLAQLTSLCKILPLNPLSDAELKVMLTKVVGKGLLILHPELLSPLNVSKIFVRAGGSPFHALALAKQMKVAVLAKRFTGVDNLPAGAHNIVLSRFDQLSNSEQVVLRTSTIIGMKFSENVLRHVLNVLHHDSYVFELQSILQALVNHNLIALEDSASVTQKSYCFTDRTCQETIYNLMVSTVRQDIHTVIAKFLEDSNDGQGKLNPSLMDEIVHHYLLSNNMVKKLQYLKLAAAEAEKMHSYSEVFKYYDQMLFLVTGYAGAELRPALCRKKVPKELPVGESSMNSRVRKAASAPSKVVDGDIETSNTVDPLSQFRKAYVPLWIDSCDIIKELKILPDIDSELSSAIRRDDLAIWLGNIATALRMYVISLFYGVYTSQFTSFCRLGNLRSCNNSIQLGLNHANIYTPSVLEDKYLSWSKLAETWKRFKFFISVPTIVSGEDFLMFQTMLQLKAALFTLRGHPNLARETLQVLKHLMKKHYRYKNSVTRVDIPTSTEYSPSDANNTSTIARDFQRSIGTAKSLNTICLLASKSYSKIAHRVNEFMNEVTIDDPLVLLCKAIVTSGLGEFGAAIKILRQCSVLALNSFDKLMHHSSMIFKAWLQFLGGRPAEARESILFIIETFTSNTSSSALATSSFSSIQVWALELKIMLNSSHLNFESAEADWKNIKLAQQKERWRLGPTTSAMVAFALVRDGRLDEAEPYATYACRKLAERQQSNVIVGVMLYCAITAALDIYESSEECSEKKTYFHKYCSTSSGSATKQAMKRLELMCASFPCLILLHYAIQFRKVLLFLAFNASAMLYETEKYATTYPEFVFGSAVFHLERAKLCQLLGVQTNSTNLSKRLFRSLEFIPYTNVSYRSSVRASHESGSQARNLSDVGARYSVRSALSKDCSDASVSMVLERGTETSYVVGQQNQSTEQDIVDAV